MKNFIIVFDIKDEMEKPELFTCALKAANRLLELANENELFVTDAQNNKLNDVTSIVARLGNNSGLYVDDESAPIFARCFQLELPSESEPSLPSDEIIDHSKSLTWSVQMSDVVGEYDVPEQVAEWEWIEENASYAHVGNGSDGVWEMQVNVQVLEYERENIPEILLPLFEKAKAQSFDYILFHQGT